MSVTVHIERLVLDGVNADPEHLRAAVSAALGQRLGAAPPAATGSATAYQRAVLPAATGADAGALGGGIAEALHGLLVPGAAAERR